MPINGICHDFAFTRCFPVESKDRTPSAKESVDLWRILRTKMELIHPDNIETLKPGVLTVTNATGHPTYTPHSYYVGEGNVLYSTNDPFFDKVEKSKVDVSTQHGVGAITYSLATLKAALNNVTDGPNGASARIGTDNRDLQFYWCSTAVARLGWWSK
ncbi:hypothetical protein VITU102760_01150 [Vibrio tubiashii]|jgi:hypothetical protein|uniref:Uncharacterized protein n=3 Tax=Vibrio tubiashii TaxID=29498 RepID=F9T3J0_9VIBR|nr:hypothetical protein [Vibrio tubiashii]AIW15694.1 hypothetical protein IX91_16475 [Vibrio tubiashii ATCC 19109]EGU56920.1 hypothetical protein VITU9109_09102 [Vibrio tubiashii ATCC 19109]EIF02668.1 hypothetical protein VT1337_18065 [Vibrio tubiashii NCIMB 1337 = ATCC 19106]NOI79835.1 hypothetical protein [Vibrio tubiashii]